MQAQSGSNCLTSISKDPCNKLILQYIVYNCKKIFPREVLLHMPTHSSRWLVLRSIILPFKHQAFTFLFVCQLIKLIMNTNSQQIPLIVPYNPENSIPPPKSFRAEMQQEESLFARVESYLSQKMYAQALGLNIDPFLKTLIFDHIQVNTLHHVLLADKPSLQFQNMKSIYSSLDLDRQARMKALINLKNNRSLNTKLVNHIACNLQDLLLDQFEPLSSFKSNPSQVFLQLYQRLNQIHQKIELLKSNAPHLALIQAKTIQLYNSNKSLKQRLERTKEAAQKYQNEASQVTNEIILLKRRLQDMQRIGEGHEREKLRMKVDFNQQLRRKEEQYERELQQLRSNSRICFQVSSMEEDLTFTIDQFKNLILKLNLENKLLREERDLLLSQLSRIYERVQIFSSIYKPSQDNIAVLTSQEDTPTPLVSSNNIISLLRNKLSQLEQQLSQQSHTLQEREEELRELREQQNEFLRQRKEQESGYEAKKQRRYKRSYGSELVRPKISELQALRARDQQTIQSLSQLVQDLNHQLIKSHYSNIEGDSFQLDLSNVRERQSTLKLESVIEQQRNTSISINSAILTPRAMADSHLTHKQLITRVQSLEQEVEAVRDEKQFMNSCYWSALSVLQEQLGIEQLSVINLQLKIEELEQRLAQGGSRRIGME